MFGSPPANALYDFSFRRKDESHALHRGTQELYMR